MSNDSLGERAVGKRRGERIWERLIFCAESRSTRVYLSNLFRLKGFFTEWDHAFSPQGTVVRVHCTPATVGVMGGGVHVEFLAVDAKAL